MKTRYSATRLVPAVTGLALGVAVSHGAIVFTEDFESPDVTAYDPVPPSPPAWVVANQGFGNNRQGLTDKAGGDFSAPDPNQQAWAFRYTNSGITTAEGVIGALAPGATITVALDVVADPDTQFNASPPGTAFTAQLIAFAPGAARNDARSTPAGSLVLGQLAGDSPDDGSFATVSFAYTTGDTDDAAYLGYDLGVRLIGATSSAIVDNVSVDVTVVPESSAAMLLGLGGLGLLLRRRPC